MAAAPQQGGGDQGNNAGILWTVAAIFAAGAAIWYGLKKYIVVGFLHLKLWEIDIVNTFFNSIGFQKPNLENLHTLLANVLAGPNPSVLTFNQILMIGQEVGNYYKYPLVVLLLILSVAVFFGNSTRVFKRTYSMKEFVKLEQVNWPQITPVVGLDLVKQDLDKGPWAMAMTPFQFCRRHKLFEEYKRTGEGLSARERSKIEVSLRRGQASKVFAIQLGPLWQGVNKLPPYARALFAAFAAKANADSKAAADLLARIARSSSGKLDFTGADALIKKYGTSPIVEHAVNSHAYVLTVMISMLIAAREDGVQASADFLWLKPVDRRLWFVLNTVGRQTPFVEAAGPFAHWLAERDMGKKILVPMIEEATNALELVLKEIIYKPEEAK